MGALLKVQLTIFAEAGPCDLVGDGIRSGCSRYLALLLRVLDAGLRLLTTLCEGRGISGLVRVGLCFGASGAIAELVGRDYRR